jgi:hypothetical protein
MTKPKLDRQMMMLVGGAIGGGGLGLYLQDKLIRHYEGQREKHIEKLVDIDIAAAKEAALACATGGAKTR